MSQPSQPKRHHYVPEFYLNQWCAETEQLVVYPLDGRMSFRTTPKNVAVECNLYRPIPGASDVRHDHEQWFSGWEGHFAKVWPDIFDRGGNPDTRKNLARFLATLMIRHPASREIVGEINRRLKTLADESSGNGRIAIRNRHGETEISVADIREYVATDTDSIRTDWLRQMPNVSRFVGDEFFARKWAIFCTDVDSFITSDAPVGVHQGASRREKFGIGTPGTFITFPISPRRFLIIADEWQNRFQHCKLDDERGFIRQVVLSADRFVFTRSENPVVAEVITEINELLGSQD